MPLQGKLEGEVYMLQTPDFELTNHLTIVCRLKKPLYGLEHHVLGIEDYSNISPNRLPNVKI